MGLTSLAASADTKAKGKAPAEWFDSAFVTIDTVAGTNVNEPGRVFRVSANGGVPWIRDPNTNTWINLRGIESSGGGAVTNMTVADNRLAITADDAVATDNVNASLLIAAETASGSIYQTTCTWGATVGSPLPATATTAFFPAGPSDLTPPCGPGWTLID
ncbi:hypothetical protein Pth03_72540 [Planotetraspora thailandica]|uniref:Uncharacterized protein n=1 Tax=Planotetraspora thailandica TaxID=487172 RepID=A0A8J3Y118_9ACTN|nr:hypothetical protein [Planotetraspora thailandica]GII58865.1 hypothetical protein Pth03_72540 [Planotetraspora thailandica]